MKLLVLNYDEIYLKGKNQRDFVHQLLRNLKIKLKDFRELLHYEGAHGGAYFIELKTEIPEDVFLRLKNKIRTTPGVSSYYFANVCPPEKELIIREALSMAVETQHSFESFGVAARRIDKQAAFTSLDLNREVGAAIVHKLGKKVDLSHPDKWFRIKLRRDKALVYHQLEPGIGGLPVGSSGKAVALLSGGIDSPVAAQMAMVRGLRVVAVHYHSVPMTSPKSIEKVKQLLVALAKYHPAIKLYLVPVYDIQQAIINLGEPRMRLLLLRRMMLLIANSIAEKEGATALVTGDSLGQVATQTLENMTAIQAVSSRIILRPLVALSKSDIIQRAREIATYDISITPHDDTCALFVPKRPVTRAKVEEVDQIFERLDVASLIESALDTSEILHLNRS